MQTVDERPTEEGKESVVKTKSPMSEPIAVEYVAFEEQSVWTRSRTWIWALLMVIFLGIGLGAMILPGFVIGC